MQSRGQLGEVVARQRLTAGQTHAAYADPGKDTHDAFDFIEREPVTRFGKIPIAAGQTVGTAQIAAVRDGQTDVFNLAAERINEHLVHAPHPPSTRRLSPSRSRVKRVHDSRQRSQMPCSGFQSGASCLILFTTQASIWPR